VTAVFSHPPNTEILQKRPLLTLIFFARVIFPLQFFTLLRFPGSFLFRTLRNGVSQQNPSLSCPSHRQFFFLGSHLMGPVIDFPFFRLNLPLLCCHLPSIRSSPVILYTFFPRFFLFSPPLFSGFPFFFPLFLVQIFIFRFWWGIPLILSSHILVVFPWVCFSGPQPCGWFECCFPFSPVSILHPCIFPFILFLPR